jgi:hypothetical protein
MNNFSPVPKLLLAACWTVFLLGSCAESAKYSVRGDAPAGSLIGQESVHSNGLPLNQRYGQLSDGDKQKVFELVAKYDKRLKPDGEPPFPSDGLGPVYSSFLDEYHQIVRPYRYPWQGNFSVLADVGPDGQVSGLKQYGIAPTDIGAAVGNVIRHTKFKPALCQGTPCPMKFPFFVNFLTRDVDSAGRYR